MTPAQRTLQEKRLPIRKARTKLTIITARPLQKISLKTGPFLGKPSTYSRNAKISCQGLEIQRSRLVKNQLRPFFYSSKKRHRHTLEVSRNFLPSAAIFKRPYTTLKKTGRD